MFHLADRLDGVRVCGPFLSDKLIDGVLIELSIRHGLAVDDERVAGKLDRIARDRDDTFDQPRAVPGRIEDDDFAALWIRPFRDVDRGERNLQVIRELVHEDAIAFDDRRLHRAGWDDVPIGNRGPHGEKRHQQNQ